MAWQINFNEIVEKKLSKLGATASKQIIEYLKTTVAISTNPYEHGKQLKGNLRGYWRYRTGDYRIICKIENDIITIFVVDVGHRKHIYKNRA